MTVDGRGPSPEEMGVDVSRAGGAVVVDASEASPDGGAFSLDDLPPADVDPLAGEDAAPVVVDETPEEGLVSATPATQAEPVAGATLERPKTQQELAKEKRMTKLDESIKATAKLAESGKLLKMAKYRKKDAGEHVVDGLKSFAKKAVIGGAIGGFFAGPLGILAGIGGAAGSELGVSVGKIFRGAVDKIGEMSGRENKQEDLRRELEILESDRLCKLADLAVATAEAIRLPEGEKITFEGAEYTADEMRLKYFEFVTKMADPNSAENQAMAEKEKKYKKGEVGWKLFNGLLGVAGGILAGGAITEAIRATLTQQIALHGVNMKTGGIGELADTYGSESLKHMQTLGHNVHVHNGGIVFDYQGGAGGAELQEIGQAMQNAPAWLQNGHFFNSELIQQGMHEAEGLRAQFTEIVGREVQTKIYGIIAGIGAASAVVDMFRNDRGKKTGKVEAISKETLLSRDLAPTPASPAAPAGPAAPGGEGGGEELAPIELRIGGIYGARTDLLGSDGAVILPRDGEVTLASADAAARTVVLQQTNADGETATWEDYPIDQFQTNFIYLRGGAAPETSTEEDENEELEPGEISADEQAELDDMPENEREFMEAAYALRGARGPIARAERENPDDEVTYVGEGTFQTYQDLMDAGDTAGFDIWWSGPEYGHIPNVGTAEFVVTGVVCSRNPDGQLRVDFEIDIIAEPDPDILARGYERKGFFNEAGNNEFDAEAFRTAVNEASLTEPVIIRLSDGQVLHANPSSAGNEGFSIFNPDNPDNPPQPIKYNELTEEGLSGALGVDWYVKKSTEPVVEEAPLADGEDEVVPLPGGSDADAEVPLITEKEAGLNEIRTLVNRLAAVGPVKAVRHEGANDDIIDPDPGKVDKWFQFHDEIIAKKSDSVSISFVTEGIETFTDGSEYMLTIDGTPEISEDADGKVKIIIKGRAEAVSGPAEESELPAPEGDPAAAEKERIRQEINDLAVELVAFGSVKMRRTDTGAESLDPGFFPAYLKLKNTAESNGYEFRHTIVGMNALASGTEFSAIYDSQEIIQDPDGKMIIKVVAHVETAPAPANPEADLESDISGSEVLVNAATGEINPPSAVSAKYPDKRFSIKPDLSFNKPAVDFYAKIDLAADSFGITPDPEYPDHLFVPITLKPADGFTEAERGGFFLEVDIFGRNWDKFNTRFANRETSGEVFTLRDRNLIEYTITGQDGDDYIMTSAAGETRMTADKIKANIVDWYAKAGEVSTGAPETENTTDAPPSPEAGTETTIDADVEALSAQFVGKEFEFTSPTDFHNVEADGFTLDDQMKKLVEKYPDFSAKPMWFLPESASGKARISSIKKYEKEGYKYFMVKFDIEELNPDAILSAAGYEQRGTLQSGIKGNNLEKYKKAIDSGEQVVVRDYKGGIYLMTGKNATTGDRYWEGRPFDPITGTIGEPVPSFAMPVDWYVKKADGGAPVGEPATDTGTTESPVDEPPAERLPFERLENGRIRLNYPDGKTIELGGPESVTLPITEKGEKKDATGVIMSVKFSPPVTEETDLDIKLLKEGSTRLSKVTYKVSELKQYLLEKNPGLLRG